MDNLLNFVLELYRLAQEVPVTEFKGRSLEMLKAFVPFRIATWSDTKIANSTVRGAEVFSMHSQREGATEWLSLYPLESHGPFTEHECAVINALTPHLAQAIAINSALALRVHSHQGQAMATDALALIRCDVLVSDGGESSDLLREHWSEWPEARLPAALLASLESTNKTCIADGRIGNSNQSVGAAVLLTAPRASSLERLSPRELEIAREFGAGKPYKKIARETQLAPATVRNVLQHVYKKLGIHNKVALARLLEHEQLQR